MEVLWFSRRRRYLMSHARGSVLEIGSGPGTNLRFYPGKVTCVTALDPNKCMLDRLERRGADHGFGKVRCLRTHQGVGEDLPFRDRTFDTVVFTLILCSVQDPKAAISEAVRVLRPGGTLIAMEHESPIHAPQAALFRIIAPLWAAPSGCHLDRHTSELLDAILSLRKVHEGRYGPVLGRPFYYRVMRKV
jgi:ubiquinone/menaquinone biosynthesis C-methylase UbiE